MSLEKHAPDPRHHAAKVLGKGLQSYWNINSDFGQDWVKF
jgi:hypothetical protein